MSRFPRILLLGGLLSLALGGCDSPLAPSAVAGTYVLETVGSSPLPLTLVDGDYVTITLLADTLRLRADGTGTATSWHDQQWHQTPANSGVAEYRSPISYRVRKRRVEVTYACHIGAACLSRVGGPRVGQLTAGGIVFEAEYTPHVYRRAD